ncbi:hypothetical protein ACFYYL_08780 [Actinomadura geliboluensis]|uniref:hypothetical protein n=1 Tax=Actinomadura geliboluensis TaxID=882440 RepID=UPI0036A9CBC0
MASVVWHGKIWNLMWVARPSGTHLSQSRSTPGGSSTLSRDDDNRLVTHADLLPANKALMVGAAVVLSAGIAVGVIAAPHVKSRFNDIKSKLNGKPEDSAEAAQEARPEQSDMGAEEPPSGNRHLSAA